MKAALIAIFVSLIAAIQGYAQGDTAISKANLKAIRLPPGFSISLVATDLDRPRQLALSPAGNLAAGSLGTSVTLLTPEGERITLGGLLGPNGVAFRGGDLYVAETSRILRFSGLDAALARKPFVAPTPTTITDRLPGRAHHGLRVILFGPDNKLYVGIGAPCNVCESSDGDERYGTILRMEWDGSNPQIFARGVRNTVGFDWDPKTRDLWFTDNGRDLLGDDTPPDELNRAPAPGLNFGFPYCHGRAVSDPVYGAKHACTEFVRPEFELPAHVAPLGMTFYTGMNFPPAYRGRIFIAEHGSWNRSIPIGYRLSVIDPAAPPSRDPQGAYQIFAEGWLVGSRPWGRPVSVINAQDGALLVSDDFAGAIYRIHYDGGVTPQVLTPSSSRKATKLPAARGPAR